MRRSGEGIAAAGVLVQQTDGSTFVTKDPSGSGAVTDSYTVRLTSAPTSAVTINVLDNDSDPEGHALTMIKVSDPANGTLAINPDGSFSYTPNSNYNGSDSFTYTITDDEAEASTATVTVTVTPVSDVCAVTVYTSFWLLEVA